MPALRTPASNRERLRTASNGQVAYTEILRSDYAATGATPADTEDLVNYTRSLEGVEVGLFFMEQPRGGVKVSFRARSTVNVGQIAEEFRFGLPARQVMCIATTDGNLVYDRFVSTNRQPLRQAALLQ